MHDGPVCGRLRLWVPDGTGRFGIHGPASRATGEFRVEAIGKQDALGSFQPLRNWGEQLRLSGFHTALDIVP